MATKRMGRPPADAAKVVIYSRIDKATVAALDEMRARMRPKPTRAQLIDAALAEYVERHRDGGTHVNKPR
jgi:hypothetical protein